MTQLSVNGAIDIIAREGICLEWYYDSVGVPTIGVGETKSDGPDPRTRGPLSLQQAVDSFKEKIQNYTKEVDRLAIDFDQFQYDAISSFDYNVGDRNLITLCHHRNKEQIGQALMLYLKPKEIKQRRIQEQRLYIHGVYQCQDGHVLVFPVTASRHPNYHAGKMVDIRPYFQPLTA